VAFKRDDEASDQHTATKSASHRGVGGRNEFQKRPAAIQEFPILGSGGFAPTHVFHRFQASKSRWHPQSPRVNIDAMPPILRPECQKYRLIEIDIGHILQPVA
jgi:hypothetical protein